ncbi:hypothetical protein FRX31_025882 [Thalictrum thalictroides]|uniref:Uncharacterized protein n=1 Tax=Thalictrum thalictroides TaxID=46969 RepID=A0A7J6VIJ6_THATH|nr:hypothetical protein FRX31_025882 [Thalictrum thalictroides]
MLANPIESVPPTNSSSNNKQDLKQELILWNQVSDSSGRNLLFSYKKSFKFIILSKDVCLSSTRVSMEFYHAARDTLLLYEAIIPIKDVSERKIRFTSNLPLKELLEKIEDIER